MLKDVNLLGKFVGAFMGLPFGLFGLLMGLSLGHLFDLFLENILSSNLTRHKKDNLIFCLFCLYGRVVAHSGQLTNAHVLFLKTEVFPYFRLGISDQTLALEGFQLALKEASQESPKENYKNIGLLCDSIHNNFFLDRHTLLWIYATCQQLIRLQPSRSGVEKILELIALSLHLVEKGSSNEDFDASDQRGDWQTFQQPSRGFDSLASDAYLTLGVSSQASNEEIKKKYRALVRRYHPDQSSHLSEKEKSSNKEQFLQVQSAYELIKKVRNIL